MTSKQDTQPTVGFEKRHSLTIETNPLHLLPSNIRRFSTADQMKPGAVGAALSKLGLNNAHLRGGNKPPAGPKTVEVPVEKKEEEEEEQEAEEKDK